MEIKWFHLSVYISKPNYQLVGLTTCVIYFIFLSSFKNNGNTELYDIEKATRLIEGDWYIDGKKYLTYDGERNKSVVEYSFKNDKTFTYTIDGSKAKGTYYISKGVLVLNFNKEEDLKIIGTYTHLKVLLNQQDEKLEWKYNMCYKKVTECFYRKGSMAFN